MQEDDPASWDDFIRRFPSSGPFHTRAWAECFRGEGLTPHYLTFTDQGRPIGAIVGVIVNPASKLLSGIDRRLSCFSGPALSHMDSGLIRDCMLGLRDHARTEGFTSVISSGRDYPYAYDWGGAKVHLQALDEYFIDLSGSWADIQGRMRKSMPEQARKAARSGLTFRAHRDASMLSPLLDLLENTRQRRQRISGIDFSPFYVPHLSERPLRALGKTSLARFFAAHHDGEVMCVLLVFVFCKRAYALSIGCSDEGYRLRAPAFVWVNAINELKTAGVESLNLAGGGPQSGHAFSKVSLGAERRTCMGSVSPYLKGPVRNLLFQTSRWANGLMEHVPLVRCENRDRS